MSWTDRFRSSGNVDDRRPEASKPAPGKTASAVVGVGLLAGLLGYCGGQQMSAVTPEVPSDDAGKFVASVLGDLEDRWKENFGDHKQPKLTLYTRSLATKDCGGVKSAYGPFYCPEGERIFLDTSFFKELTTPSCKKQGPACEFARAHVIAHEYGHHMQKLMGIFDIERGSMSEDQINVRTELQADCFAGLWAGWTNTKWNNITPDMIKAAQEAAQFGGDGPRGPPSHGTPEQRTRWFMKGYSSKALVGCNPFTGDL